jgi:hypothetical protein
MRKRLGAPSPALVIALVALFVALGGTGYAALRLPRNSVGTIQLQNGAVVAAKIRNGTIVGSKLRNGAVTAGKINTKGLSVPNAVHATTALNALSAAAATSATSATTATSAGTATTALSPGTLASGKTEAGVYDVDFVAAAAGDSGAAAISFPFPLASAPKVEWLGPGAPSDANCPGSAASPQAAAGFLCLYASTGANVASYTGGGAQPYGALPVLTAKVTNTRTVSTGSCAVTAP